MSLSKASVGEITKKQYHYKLKSYVWVFNSLILLQLMAILFSLGGSMSSGWGQDEFYLEINYYSADIMIAFTMLWAFIISNQIISNKRNEFVFINSQLSHHLSDATFLFTTSFLGGITATLSGFLLKVLTYFFVDSSKNILTGLMSGPKYFIIGMLATILFVFLFSALGYIVGMLIKLNKLFTFLLPVVFIGLLFIANKYGESNFMLSLFNFYFKETVFGIFVLKIILTSFLLFLGAFMISKRWGAVNNV